MAWIIVPPADEVVALPAILSPITPIPESYVNYLFSSAYAWAG